MMNLVLEWVMDKIAGLINDALSLIFSFLSFDPELFITAFPFASSAYGIFLGIGVGFALLLGLVRLIGCFLSGENTDSPMRTAVSVIGAVFAIYMGNYVLEGIMDIFKSGFDALLEEVATGSTGSLGSLVLYGGNLLVAIIGIVCCWNLIKLSFEVLQRYILCYILLFIAPIPFSLLANSTTAEYTKKFLVMFIGQCLLMLMDLWFVKMGISAMLTSGYGGHEYLMSILYMLMALAALKIGQRMDTIMGQMGLPTASLGGNLLSDMVAAGSVIASVIGTGLRFSGRSGSGGGPGGNSPVLGSGGGGAMNPFPPTTDFKGVVNTGRQAARATNGNAFQKAMAGVGAAVKRVPAMFPGSKEAKALYARNMAQAADAAINGGMAPDQRMFAMRDAGASGAIMRGFQDGAMNNEPRDAAAVVSGLGLNQMDRGAQEMVDVAQNKVAATDISSTMDESGILFSYQNNGKKVEHQIATEEQMRSNHSQNMDMFTQYRGADGRNYYYRRSESYAPTQRTAQRENIDHTIGNFAAAPSSSPLTAPDAIVMQQNQDVATTVFSRMDTANTEISFANTGAELTQAQKQDLASISYALDGIKIDGMNAGLKSSIVSSLRSYEVDRAVMNGNGLQVDYSDRGQPQSFVLYTESGAMTQFEQNGSLDKHALLHSGYRVANIGGQDYWWKAENRKIH